MSRATTKGLESLLFDIQQASAGQKAAVAVGLKKLGDMAVARIRKQAKGGEFGVKANGDPHLIRTGNYLEHLTPVVSADGTSLDIEAQGENEHMSNHDLSQKLELKYPHLRPTGQWIEQNGAEIVGKEVLRVFGNTGGH